MTNNNLPKGNSDYRSSGIKFIVAGFFAGIVIMGLLVWLLMPGMMLSTHESRFNTVDETCESLKAAIMAEDGWYCPKVRNITETIHKHGRTLTREVKLVELCHAGNAQKVLESNPEVSTLMPCAFGVYKADDGRILITGMNTALMGKMFGGVIAEVMGENVANSEERILNSVIKKY